MHAGRVPWAVQGCTLSAQCTRTTSCYGPLLLGQGPCFRVLRLPGLTLCYGACCTPGGAWCARECCR
eukprot:1159913-Pelagomonas_calceolata.AAC.3